MNTKYIYAATIIFLLGLVGYLSLKISSPQPMYKQQMQNSGNMDRSTEKNLEQQKIISNGVESKKNCVADGCLAIDNLNYPVDKLADGAKTALTKALDDEYKAQATYETIITKLGNVRPFIMIIRAEEQHIASLKSLFDKYGMEIPANPYTGKITVPETLAESCAAGVDAEIANAALYKEDLLPNVKEYEDITAVFTNLMNASQEKHLVAFQRCAK